MRELVHSLDADVGELGVSVIKLTLVFLRNKTKTEYPKILN